MLLVLALHENECGYQDDSEYSHNGGNYSILAPVLVTDCVLVKVSKVQVSGKEEANGDTGQDTDPRRYLKVNVNINFKNKIFLMYTTLRSEMKRLRMKLVPTIRIVETF